MNRIITSMLSFALCQTAFAKDYEDLKAAEKLQMLEQMQVASEYSSKPAWTGLELLPALRFLLPFQQNAGRRFMGVTIDRQSDFMPEDRPKVLHALGAVGSVRFVGSEDHDYTGLFRGAEHAIARFSLGAAPGENSFAPGIAVKFLIDGQPSRNFVAMFSLDGQESANFFENSFSNIVPSIKGALLRFASQVIELVTDFSNKTRVDQLATILPNGELIEASKAKSPEQILMIPNAELDFADEAHDFRDDLITIAVGTKLYDLYALEGETKVYLGYLELTSPIRLSEFGDKQLFFKHTRFEDQEITN